MLNTCTTMKQKETAPESGEGLQLLCRGGDTLNLPSPSAEELEVNHHGSCTEPNNIKQLLNEFKELYDHRLRCLELDTTVTGEELLQKKVNFLRSYVSDLGDQNQVLVQTIEDLQKDTDHKASSWGMKHPGSGARLNVSEDDLRTVLLDEPVGPVAHIPHSSGSLVQIASMLEDLKVQSLTKDMVISDLETELRENAQQKQKNATQVVESSERLGHLQSQLSCLQHIHADSVKEMAEKDFCITKLQANLQLLQQEGSDTQAQLSKLSTRERELQEDLRRTEERRRQEQQKREEEKKKMEGEWKRDVEEERKAHAQAVKKWAEKAAIFKSELKVSRRQVERQNKELSEFQHKEKTLLSEAHAKAREELSGLFDRRMEEKEVEMNQLTEDMNGLRVKMKEREEHARHLEQDSDGLRATQDSLKRTLTMKEKHTQQLVQDNIRLKESLASIHSKLQTSECMLSDVSETLDQTKGSLNTEREHRQQTQEQLQQANKEVERLLQELTRVHCTTEKKIQKREIKMCALVKELTDSQKQHSESQKELLQRESAWKQLCEERDELRAKMEERSRESVHLNQTKDRLEADLELSHEKLNTSRLEVRSRNQLILQLRAEMKAAEEQHQNTLEQVAALEGGVRQLKSKVKGQQEERCQLSLKVGDMERLKQQKEREQQQLQDQLCVSQHQVETLEGKLKAQEEEMKLLHQQLKGAKEELEEGSLQAQGQKETSAIFRQKYTAAMEKVHKVQGQVEHLQEELRYSQQQLRESQSATQSVKEELAEMAQRYQEKVDQWESSQEALDQLTDELQANQNLLREGLQKEDHFKGLLGALQEQSDALKQQKLTLECDLKIYQQSHSHSDEEYLGLLRHRQKLQKRCTEQVERLAECEKAILQMKSELERQNQEKVGLKQSLAANHRTHMSNRSQLEEEVTCLKKEVTRLELELAETQKVHAKLLRRSEEVKRLQEKLQKEEEERKSAVRDKQSLSAHVKHLSHELGELRSKHQVTVEELAARAEEARRMEGCLNEGKLAEEKIRSMVVRLQSELEELKRNLQQSVSHQHKAEREKRVAQEQVDTLRSDNANLRRESQLVMSNVNHWITEQKASNKNLTAQLKAQNKALQHLQEANDTLSAEVKRLKETARENERDAERLKQAQIREQGIRQDERNSTDKQGCVALNLSKIEDMHTRLRSNLEAIGTLNQQLNALGGENERLRGQLEEERSMRRRVELLFPPPTPPPTSVHLPLSLSACPPPPSSTSTSSLDPCGTGDIGGILTRTKLSGVGLSGECLPPWKYSSWSGRMSRDPTK